MVDPLMREHGFEGVWLRMSTGPGQVVIGVGRVDFVKSVSVANLEKDRQKCGKYCHVKDFGFLVANQQQKLAFLFSQQPIIRTIRTVKDILVSKRNYLII